MSGIEYQRYRRKGHAEGRPWEPGEKVGGITGISITDADRDAGSPKPGDMIFRNPKNYNDQWLVAAQYFKENFEPAD